jgi:hypothetical protein
MYTFKWLRLKHIFFSLLILVSCGKPLPTLEGIDLQTWKDDKDGCSGKRSTMLSAINSQSEKLLALSESEIISLLGRPDENELFKRNQKFYYYLVEPSKICSDTITVDPKKLVIRFNAIGLAKEVVVE